MEGGKKKKKKRKGQKNYFGSLGYDLLSILVLRGVDTKALICLLVFHGWEIGLLRPNTRRLDELLANNSMRAGGGGQINRPSLGRAIVLGGLDLGRANDIEVEGRNILAHLLGQFVLCK